MAQVHSVVSKPWRDDALVAVIKAGVRDAQRRRAMRSGSSDSFISIGGQFVLLLEDNDSDAKLLEHSIKAVAPGEFRLVRARTLAEARRFLHSRPYSAILADLGLPDASGLASLSGLLSVSPNTPILVLTGADDAALATEAVRAGAQDYLVKGNYDPEALLRAIRYAVERKRIEMRLSDLAHYDALTGLANRALLVESEKRAIARATRSGQHVALFTIDLDHFKSINDQYGHDVGDALLVEVGKRLTASTRAEDTVARIGGDEFVVLLEDLDGPEGARRVGQRIHNAFATPIFIEGKQLLTTPSVGIALFPDDAANLDELQRHADAALYEAKHAGRNTYHFFSSELQLRAQTRRALEKDLVGALAEGQFHLAYLPSVDVQSGAMCGYEALLRWQRSQGELLSAREFLQVLDESGDIVRVGKWVIGQVCEDASALAQASPVRLSINVSARELASPDFVSIVADAIRDSGISGNRIELELTELTLSEHFEDAKLKLPKLVALGVTCALDGYGAGRSSILELVELPIHTLKLHPFFLADLALGRRQAALSAMVGVAHALGWTVVATRVETKEQLKIAQDLGCQRAQGRFLGPPTRSLIAPPAFALHDA